VSAVRSGFGIQAGISTARQLIPFNPKASRTFSEKGERS